MAIDKLSMSLDESLAQIVRDAAAEENITVSAWLANAAQDRIRNRLLGLALEIDNPEIVALSTEELMQIVSVARSQAIVTNPHRGA